MMTLATLVEIVQGIGPQTDTTFSSVSIDSRTLAPGALFIAIQGEKFNGHQFVNEAKEKGAVAVLVHEKVNTDLPQIKVENTRLALLELARFWRSQFQLPIVGITGSSGKTTTRALIASILNECAETLASESSYNNDIGVPFTLLKLRKNHQFAVIEMGANHAGEIAVLTELVKPHVALITNAGPAHLEGFGDLAGVAKAKGEIFQSLTNTGFAIINRDDVFFEFWEKNIKSNYFCFGLKNPADVMAENLTFNAKMQSSFILKIANKETPIHLPLMGQHNVMNALAAATVAAALKLPIEPIKQGLEKMQAVTRRLAEQAGLKGATIIDDSYNANPASMLAAIDVLAKCQGVSIFIMGDMLELGEASDLFHRQIGETAFKKGIQHFFCLGSLSQCAAKGFGQKAQHFSNQDQLIAAVKPLLDSEVTVLIKGSNKMGMNLIAAALSINC